MDLIFISLAGLFFLGHGLNWFFIRTKVPDLLILVFLGYALGPIFGIVNPEDLGRVGAVLSTTALIVILYQRGGIHLSVKDLLTSSLPALKISFLAFGLIALTGGHRGDNNRGPKHNGLTFVGLRHWLDLVRHCDSHGEKSQRFSANQNGAVS